jgi:hypothetical protein
MRPYANNAEKILAAMPGTKEQIADRTGLSEDTVRNTLGKYLRPPNGPKRAFISDWCRLSRGGRGSAVYSAGDLPDVEYQKTDISEYNREYGRQRRAQAQKERRARAKEEAKTQPAVQKPKIPWQDRVEAARKRQLADEYCKLAASEQQTPFSALFAGQA